jgi:hypothetical protein
MMLIINSEIPTKSIHRITSALVKATPHLEVFLDCYDMDRWIQAFSIRHKFVSYNIKVSYRSHHLPISPADDGQCQHEQ